MSNFYPPKLKSQCKGKSMADKSVKVRLSDHISVLHGFAFKGEHFNDTGNGDILVTPGNFEIGGGFRDAKYKYYSGPSVENFILNSGDLIISMTDLSKAGDTLGAPALVPLRESSSRFLHNQRIGKVEIKTDLLDKSFLFYLLRTSDFHSFILGSATGSTVRHTSPSRIGEFEIYLPPLPIQRQIAAILSAFDDKIELNRRMNRTLEALARALFKSWFVDFDPVRAKMRGEQPEGMDAETAALFPDELVEVDGREVPKGWRVGSLGDIVQFNPTLKLPKDQEATYLDMGSMPIDGMSANGWFLRSFGSGSRFQNGDTLLARITPCLENGKAAYVDFLQPQEVGWGSTEYIVMRPLDKTPQMLPYILCRDENFRAYAIGNMNGSSGRQRVSHQSLSEYSLVLPNKPIFEAFNTLTLPIIQQAKVVRDESARLASLRDSLLPRLLAGEIDVSGWGNSSNHSLGEI